VIFHDLLRPFGLVRPSMQTATETFRYLEEHRMEAALRARNRYERIIMDDMVGYGPLPGSKTYAILQRGGAFSSGVKDL
jgi:hypothetical protein